MSDLIKDHVMKIYMPIIQEWDDFDLKFGKMISNEISCIIWGALVNGPKAEDRCSMYKITLSLERENKDNGARIC